MIIFLITISVLIGFGAWALCAASSRYHDEYEEDEDDE